MRDNFSTSLRSLSKLFEISSWARVSGEADRRAAVGEDRHWMTPGLRGSLTPNSFVANEEEEEDDETSEWRVKKCPSSASTRHLASYESKAAVAPGKVSQFGGAGA